MNNRKVIGKSTLFWFRLDGPDDETGITFNGDVYGMVVEKGQPPRYVYNDGVAIDDTLALTTAVENLILKKGSTEV